MFGKIKISGSIKAETGLHIGGGSAFAAIGAVDAPVIRDVCDNKPMIPGSSLKGKMRTLLAKQYAKGWSLPQEHNEDDDKVRRLFGNTADKKNPKTSRLLFGDCFLFNAEELDDFGISVTEVKFENTIVRKTAVANPRQIERAVRGTKYQLNLIYNVETDNVEEIKEDFKTLANGFKLLEYDYLGGHGSRGYGQVKIEIDGAEFVVENWKNKDEKSKFDQCLEECKKVLKER